MRVSTADGTPVQGAAVSVAPLGLAGTTGTDGVVDFGEVPPGSYTATGQKDGFSPSTGGNSSDPTSQTLAAPAGTSTQFELLLNPLAAPVPAPVAHIAVHVQKTDGTPVEGAIVSVAGKGWSGVTGSDGNFDFGDVPVDSYTVTGQKDNYKPTSVDQTLSAPAAVQTMFTLVLDPVLARIAVHVETPKGTPVNGITVSVDGQGWNGVTDSGGNFNFGEVPPGSYTISATKDGYKPSPCSQQLDAPADTDTQYKLVVDCDPAVTIGNVVRGPGLPDSVPPTKSFNVQITVTPSEGCPDHVIELSIANSGGAAGTATISPTQITGNATVTVTGVVQTTPGNGGQLKIQAKLDGAALKAESTGFSVCAHPVNYSDTFVSDINGASVGVRVQDGWDSDSGTVADLDQAEDKELVGYDPPTVPPFANLPAKNSDYLAANAFTQDSHQIRKPAAGPAATWERRQLCIFKCHRCGAVDQPHVNSGFKIVHEVFQDGPQWKHRVKKFGAAVTVGAFSVGAGTASVTSPDHPL